MSYHNKIFLEHGFYYIGNPCSNITYKHYGSGEVYVIKYTSAPIIRVFWHHPNSGATGCMSSTLRKHIKNNTAYQKWLVLQALTE